MSIRVSISDNDGFKVAIYLKTEQGFKDQDGNFLINQDGTIFRGHEDES